MSSSSDVEYEGSIKRRRISPSRRFQSLKKRREKTQVTPLSAFDGDQQSDPCHHSKKPDTFFEEKLLHCRDLCSAEHFRTASLSLRSFVGPLPRVLLSKRQIMDILLSCLVPEAELSLQAVVEVIGGLARDLQDGFVEFVPELINVLSKLCHGLSEFPETLGHLFNAFSKILKQLKKHLIPSISLFVVETIQPLLMHPVVFVRRLTSQAVGSLLRQITSKKLKYLLKHVLGCICKKKGDRQKIIESFGCLLSHFCLGTQHHLHSKSEELLEILLQGNLLSSSNFHGSISSQSSADVAPQWLTEHLIQDRLFALIKCLVDESLLKAIDKESSQRLWNVVFRVFRIKMTELKTAVEDELVSNGKMVVRDCACLLYLSNRMLSRHQEILQQNSTDLLSLLDLFNERSLLKKLQSHSHSFFVVAKEAESDSIVSLASFPGQMVTFLILCTRIFKSSNAHTVVDRVLEKLNKLEIFLKYLTPTELLMLGRKAVRENVCLPGLIKQLSEALSDCRICLSAKSKEQLFVLFWKMIPAEQSASSDQLLRVLKETQFSVWLLELIQEWPDNLLGTSMDLQAVVRVGILGARCLSWMYADQQDLIINTSKHLLTEISKLQTTHQLDVHDQKAVGSCLSAAKTQLTVIVVEAQVKEMKKQGLQDCSDPILPHLKEALNQLESSSTDVTKLKNVSILLKMLESLNKANLDSVFGQQDAEKWIMCLEENLKSHNKQSRCSLLEILSKFDHYFPQSFSLFSTFLEIETGELNGLNRKAGRLVEMIAAAVEQESLHPVLKSPCWYGLLGLLNVPFQPIWASITSALSHLLNKQFSHFWPVLLEEIKSSHTAVLSSLNEIEQEEEETLLVRRFDEEVFMKDSEDPRTDNLTKLLLLLDTMEGLESEKLKQSCADWIPLLLQWNEDKRLGRGNWCRVIKSWLTVMSRIESLESLEVDKDEILEVLISLLTETELQKLALSLLSKFDLKFLPPYMVHLLKFTEPKEMKSVFLDFPLDVERGLIDIQHRPELIPILTRLLFPHIKSSKMKKVKGDSVLGYLAQAQSHELVDLMEVAFAPWDGIFVPSEESSDGLPTGRQGLIQHKWWVHHLLDNSVSQWAEMIDRKAVQESPRGLLLQTVDRLLMNLGHKATPYLSFLLALLSSILVSCHDQNEVVVELADEGLLLLSSVLDRFPHGLGYLPVLEMITPLLLRLLPGLEIKVKTPRVPALLTALHSIAQLPCFQTILDPAQTSNLQENFLTLLKETFTLLSNPDCSQSSLGIILSIVESCLMKEIAIKNELLQILLQALQSNISSTSEGNQKSKAKRETLQRGLRILERVLELDINQDSIHALVQALISMMSSRNESHLNKALDCLAAVWTKTNTIQQSSETTILAEEELRTYAHSLARKASKLYSTETRLSLSQAFTSLVQLLPALSTPARIFTSLVSFVPNQLEGIDYEKRLEAYESLTEEFWQSGEDQDYEILLHGCLFDLQHASDLSLRQASYGALYRLITSRALSQSTNKRLFDCLCQKVGSSALAVRQDHLSLLAKILELDDGVEFQLVSSLLFHPDVELDFFRNVACFQLSNRIKAWQRILKKLEKENLDLDPNDASLDPTLVLLKSSKILFPLLFQAIFEGQASEQKSKGKKSFKINEGKESSLVETCVKVLSKIAGLIPWTPYDKLLSQVLFRVKQSLKPFKGMVRALCTVVDSFHRQSAEDQEAMKIPFSEKVLPVLQSLLLDESGETAALPVAVSLARLTASLPEETGNNLDGFLLKLGNLLLHRVQHIRDAGLEVFLAVASTLGCPYLQDCVKALLKTLPMRGYTAHILDFTLHAVLEKVVQESSGLAEIDGVVELVVPVISDSLFGEPAEARAAKQFSAKYKEAKNSKSVLTFQILCKACTFQVMFPKFIAFLQDRLSFCGSPRQRKIVESLLDAAVHGFVQNPSLPFNQKLQSIKDLIIDQIDKQANSNPVHKTHAGTIEEMQESVQQQKQEHILKYGYLLQECGLKMFRKCLKISKSLSLEILDSFISVLINCLHSHHSVVSILALKSFCLLISYPLPSLQDQSSEIGRSVICLLDSAVDLSTDSIAQDCLKLLARMLHGGEGFQPTPMQVNSLLTLIDSDLEEQGDLQSGIKLLRAIVDRKIVVPKLYDLMVKIRGLVIRSQSSQMREMGSTLYLRFLLTFPLSSMQVEQHLVFILGNLSYEYETGRVQALELLNQVILKFPSEFVDEKSALLYIPLVKRLTEESINSCKNQVIEVLKLLLNKMETKNHELLLQMNLEWMKNSEEDLHLVGFQAMTLFFDINPTLCFKHEQQLISLLKTSLFQPEGEWKEFYLTLHLLEKLCTTFQNSCSSLMEKDSLPQSDVWIRVVEMLDYPHAWIRASASRLVGHVFSTLEPEIAKFLAGDNEVILGSKNAPQLAFACYVMLESDTIDEKTAKQCSKNLVWLSPILHVHSSSAPSKEKSEIEPSNAQGSGLSLMGVISRMVKLADLRSEAKSLIRISAFKFLGALGIRLKSFEFLSPYLSLMLQPIYRIMENKEIRETELEAKNIAQEVMDHIKDLVSGDEFREAYFKARQSVEEARAKRKAKEALQKVMNPQTLAKRKLTQHRKKAELKKRRKWIRTPFKH